MPSNRLPACAFRRSSGSAFQPICKTCVSQVNLPALPLKPHLRLSSVIVSAGAALQLIFDRRLGSIFRPCLRTNPRRLSSAVSLRRCPPVFLFDSRLQVPLPALPAEHLPTHRLLNPFGAALQLTVDSRLRLTFRPCLANPTSNLLVAAFSGCAFRLTDDSRLRSSFQFRLPTFSSACASDRSSGYLPVIPLACASV
jgi:hypothetical protein